MASRLAADSNGMRPWRMLAGILGMLGREPPRRGLTRWGRPMPLEDK